MRSGSKILPITVMGCGLAELHAPRILRQANLRAVHTLGADRPEGTHTVIMEKNRMQLFQRGPAVFGRRSPAEPVGGRSVSCVVSRDDGRDDGMTNFKLSGCRDRK
jgi:hypothetical protein